MYLLLCVLAREQPEAFGLLLPPCESQGLNSGCQAQQQVFICQAISPSLLPIKKKNDKCPLTSWVTFKYIL